MKTQSELFHPLAQMVRRPAPPPARTLPVEVLELMAQLAGTGCNSHGIWDGLALAAETFDGAARRAGGCAECPPFDGKCPDDGLQVTRQLLGMLKLVGITSASASGYATNFQTVARLLERDIKAFAPKPKREPTKKARRGPVKASKTPRPTQPTPPAPEAF